MGRESACGNGGHGIVDAVKPVHAQELETCEAGYAEGEEDGPDGFCRGGQLGVQLRLYRSCSLCCKDFYRTSHERGQYGYGEEHYSQTAYPLGEGTPEEYAMGQALHIVEYGGACGGES